MPVRASVVRSPGLINTSSIDHESAAPFKGAAVARGTDIPPRVPMTDPPSRQGRPRPRVLNRRDRAGIQYRLPTLARRLAGDKQSRRVSMRSRRACARGRRGIVFEFVSEEGYPLV